MKPNLFIGSSTEQLETAYAIQTQLERACEPSVWDQGVFELSSNALDDLIAQLDKADFAVFVFGPDDFSTIREKEYETTRDNVVLELGLFIGRLGKARTFFVLPRNRRELRIPSDLLGVIAATYDDSREDRRAALGPACFSIQERIEALGVRQERLPQPAIEAKEIGSVLCLSTSYYESLGVEGDIEVLESAFPGKVEVKRSVDLATLERELLSAKPDLIHILVSIDENTGELCFPGESGQEFISSEGFARLVAHANPSLVVLATCDSLFTAHHISRSTNVIAASGDIETDLIVRWSRLFYGALASGSSLSNAFEIATSTTDAPVVLNLKRDFTVAS
jgi:hypothetical protein